MRLLIVIFIKRLLKKILFIFFKLVYRILNIIIIL